MMNADDPPAATVELDGEDVEMALSKSYPDRHHELDAYASLYQHASKLLKILPKADNMMQESGYDDGIKTLVDVSDLHWQLDTLITAIAEHVLDQHEHALRWTLDPYDEMEP